MVAVRFEWYTMVCKEKNTDKLAGQTCATFKSVLKRHWNLLNVVKFIALANKKLHSRQKRLD